MAFCGTPVAARKLDLTMRELFCARFCLIALALSAGLCASVHGGGVSSAPSAPKVDQCEAMLAGLRVEVPTIGFPGLGFTGTRMSRLKAKEKAMIREFLKENPMNPDDFKVLFRELDSYVDDRDVESVLSLVTYHNSRGYDSAEAKNTLADLELYHEAIDKVVAEMNKPSLPGERPVRFAPSRAIEDSTLKEIVALMEHSHAHLDGNPKVELSKDVRMIFGQGAESLDEVIYVLDMAEQSGESIPEIVAQIDAMKTIMTAQEVRMTARGSEVEIIEADFIDHHSFASLFLHFEEHIKPVRGPDFTHQRKQEAFKKMIDQAFIDHAGFIDSYSDVFWILAKKLSDAHGKNLRELVPGIRSSAQDLVYDERTGMIRER